MTLNEIRALIAESDKTGRPIQYDRGDCWVPLAINENVALDGHARKYRVAPPKPPKPREWWVIPGRKESEFIAYPDNPKTPRDHWREAGYTLVREVMEGEKS